MLKGTKEYKEFTDYVNDCGGHVRNVSHIVNISEN